MTTIDNIRCVSGLKLVHSPPLSRWSARASPTVVCHGGGGCEYGQEHYNLHRVLMGSHVLIIDSVSVTFWARVTDVGPSAHRVSVLGGEGPANMCMSSVVSVSQSSESEYSISDHVCECSWPHSALHCWNGQWTILCSSRLQVNLFQCCCARCHTGLLVLLTKLHRWEPSDPDDLARVGGRVTFISMH